MKKVSLLVVTGALVFGSQAVSANVVDSGALQTILNNVTCSDGATCNTLGGPSSVNVKTDQYQPDEVWAIGGSGGSFATLVLSLAASQPSNIKFGAYDPTVGTKYQIFDAAVTATQAVLQLAGNQLGVSLYNGLTLLGQTIYNVSGNKFGWYVESAGFTAVPGGTLYSQVARNNWTSSPSDWMLAFQGEGDYVKLGPYNAGPWSSNEYVLAWETESLSNLNPQSGEYDDFVVLLESISSVPEPGSLALVGLGLIGLGLGRRRRSN